MKFNLEQSIDILSRTPDVLLALLKGLPDEWVMQHEGEGTWSPFDVVGHLIVCEQTNFIIRTKLILSDTADKTVSLIDMTAHLGANQGKGIFELLLEFEALRRNNILSLKNMQLTETDLGKTANHPTMGTIQLRELLSTWVSHDLIHIAQIARVMAKQYRESVGPFLHFLRVMQ